MTTTDPGAVPPPFPPPFPPPPPPSAPHRLLRRSRTDRVAAGVAGGLGEYFGLDPVLFRVLFAVSAFFGGAGLLAYVLAWAAIPEQGTQHAAVDGWIAELRRRRIPFWAVAVIGALILWGVAFSWWAPGPFFPVLTVVIVLVVVFGRRSGATPPAGPDAVPPAPAPAPTVDLTKTDATAPEETTPQAAAPLLPSPDWVSSARQWIDESKQASRERRRRAFPVRIGTLVTLVLTLIVLGIADAAGGIRLPVYFWCAGGIVTLGLLIGITLRRTPWSMAPLLIPALAGMVAFGNTGASLHDGIGKSNWSPTTSSELRGSYRLAFGQGVLDLRDLQTPDTPLDVSITMAAGQAKIILPDTLNATVHANVRMGEVDVDGRAVSSTHGGSIHRVNGYDIEHTVRPPATATGAPIAITVHQADGNLTVARH